MCAQRFDIASAGSMSLRSKIAQLLWPRMGSHRRPVQLAEQQEERIARLLDECCFGGLVLFNGGPQTRNVLDRLQARAEVPLLIGSDIERGVGQQVTGRSLFPHAMAFGNLPKGEGEAAVEDFARTLAIEASQAGIHITFGPVADVSTNPSNPIIATRAFSEDPQRAAELVSVFVRKTQSLGLFATAKHFPGHGDTDLDSHEALPLVTKTREQLEACEFIPFRAAIEAGCALIMTAHIGFPALDATRSPATFSAAVLRKLLRSEMGFSGVICSDSLLMAGARQQFESEGAMAHAALLAGVDLLLDLDDPIAVVDYLCQCVEQKTLQVEQIDESMARLWKLKAALSNSPPFEHAAPDSARSVAQKAIRVIGLRRHSALPLSVQNPLTVIFITPFETPVDSPEQPIAAALRQRLSNIQYVQLGPHSEATAYEAANLLACNSPQVVVAVVVRPAAWQTFGLLADQNAFVQQLVHKHPNVVLVSLGVPTILNDFPTAGACICTYSDVPVSQEAAVEFLLGQSGTISI